MFERMKQRTAIEVANKRLAELKKKLDEARNTGTKDILSKNANDKIDDIISDTLGNLKSIDTPKGFSIDDFVGTVNTVIGKISGAVSWTFSEENLQTLDKVLYDGYLLATAIVQILQLIKK